MTAVQPQPRPATMTAAQVITSYMDHLANTDDKIEVEQAAHELLTRLEAQRLLRNTEDRDRIAAAEDCAFILGRIPDHGSTVNAAAKAVYERWFLLCDPDHLALVGQSFTDEQIERLAAPTFARRQEMFDDMARRLPGPHQELLQPAEGEPH